jgi:hypothetical protein
VAIRVTPIQFIGTGYFRFARACALSSFFFILNFTIRVIKP